MRRLLTTVVPLLFCASSLLANSTGTNRPLSGTFPIVLSHGLFGWGDNTNGIISIANYWGGMDNYLRSQGAVVFAPAKSATNSNELRGQQLRTAILNFAAANNYTGKFHILGHSQGGLDSRHMVSNLGMASRTSTLTSLNTPHLGSPIADIAKAVLPNWLEPFAARVIETMVKVVYGGTNQQNALAALNALTTETMARFNTSNPNRSGVKYYSYGSFITIPDLIQHPLMGPLHPACAAGGLFLGQGATNDGLVTLPSMRWGTWMGTPSWPILTTGIDHLQITNTLGSGALWFDEEGFYLRMAQNMRANQ